MTMDGATQAEWADGEYYFRLGLGEIRQLEDARGVGLGTLSRRITSDWHVDDIVEVLRFGLIGGGMDPLQAKSKVDYYVERSVLHSVLVAGQVLRASLTGPPVPNEPEESEPEEKKQVPMKTSPGLSSPASTQNAL